jgi:uncharacterized protein YcbK (DUF882 family)
MAYVSNDELFPIWREPRSFWERTGLTPRQQRRFDRMLVGVVLLLVGGWVYSVIDALRLGEAPTMARQIGGQPSALGVNAPPPAAFLLEAAIGSLVDWEREFRGASGEIRVIIQEPGDTVITRNIQLPDEVEIAFEPLEGDAPIQPAPREPGIWNMMLRARDAVRQVPDMAVITTVPATELRGGAIGAYRIGAWPRQTGASAPPRGFIRVTPENMNMHVSKHFRLRDFLTKGQEGVWPKYVVISPRLLDKLELTIQELELMGHPVENVFVVSGFRTPWYNQHGGTTAGRGALSRHMYGDAADIAIDNDRNGRMDDLNGDGRVDIRDAQIVAQAAERVERKYPHLVGGIGIYRPTGGHSGMVHIDARGSRARW